MTAVADMSFDEFEAYMKPLIEEEKKRGLANLLRFKPGAWCNCPSTPDESPCESYFQREDGSHGWFHDPLLGGCGKMTQSG